MAVEHLCTHCDQPIVKRTYLCEQHYREALDRAAFGGSKKKKAAKKSAPIAGTDQDKRLARREEAKREKQARTKALATKLVTYVAENQPVGRQQMAKAFDVSMPRIDAAIKHVRENGAEIAVVTDAPVGIRGYYLAEKAAEVAAEVAERKAAVQAEKEAKRSMLSKLKAATDRQEVKALLADLEPRQVRRLEADIRRRIEAEGL